MSLAGVIESVGKNVIKFKKGDAVYASTFGVNFGGYAEYKCMPENGMLFIKPSNLSFEEAAAIPGGSTMALRFLRNGKFITGKKCLFMALLVQ